MFPSKAEEVAEPSRQIVVQETTSVLNDSEQAVNDLIRDMMNLMLRSLNVRLDGTIGRQILAQHAQRIAKSMK